MRKILWISIMLCSGSVFAQNWVSMTGTVVQVRHGKADFYTVKSRDGEQYIANSAHPHVGANEELFKTAFAEKIPLAIEFRSHINNPGSIWQIRQIDLITNTAPAVSSPELEVLPPVRISQKLSVSGMFQGGMVLQRELPVPVWGWAPSGRVVAVEFGGQKKTAVADSSNHWKVVLDPMPASSNPRKLTVSSNAHTPTLQYSNLLVGEVWVLAGQSNMEWWLQSSDGGPEAVAAADYPWLRYFTPGWQLPDSPAQNLAQNASWQECSPETAGQFSAIGFWMAEKLHQELNVPIGLIKNAVSGTYGECWVPRDVLESIPAARARLDEYQAALKILPTERARWETEKVKWEAEAAEARKNGKPEPAKSFFVRKGPMGPDHFHRPYALYNGLVAPLMPFAVRGVVWYQGEGNSQKHRVGYYEEILQGLVGSWRKGWAQEHLPFLFVQLPKFEPGPHNDWPQLREAQRKAAWALKDTDLVVTIDTGDPKQIHPTDKKPVAERVAAVALQQVYGKPFEGCSPLPLSAEQNGSSILIQFSNTGDGLIVRGTGSPSGFELAGSDGIFSPAEAEIAGKDAVKLPCPAGFCAKTVRYAYSNTPNVNLFSSGGLPVVPFVLPVQLEPADTGYGPDVPPPTFWDIPYGPHERNRIDFWQADTKEPAPLLDEFSPINHLDAEDPPIFLSYSGSEDLPPKGPGHGIHHPVLGKKMKEKAEEIGQDCRLQINGSAKELYQFYLEQFGK